MTTSTRPPTSNWEFASALVDVLIGGLLRVAAVYVVAFTVATGADHALDNDADEAVGDVAAVFPAEEREAVLEDSELPTVCRMCEMDEGRPRIPGTFLCPTCAVDTWGLTEARRVARESRAENWEEEP